MTWHDALMTDSVTRVTPAPSPLAIPAFLVHLLAWAGFVALWTATTSYDFGTVALVAPAMLALAFLAGGAAMIVGRGLGDGLRGLFVTVTIVIFGAAGVVEVGVRILVPTEGVVWAVLGSFVFLGTLGYPLILAPVVAGLTPGRRGTRAWRVPAVVVAAAGLSVAVILAVLLGPAAQTWFAGWPIATLTFVGLVASALLVRELAGEGAAPAVARVAAWVTIASGSVLFYLTWAQLVYLDATGIGGVLLWLLVGTVFAVGSLALAVSAFVAERRPRPIEGPVPVA